MRKQTKIWTTKDGSRIRVCDMNDSHLCNAARMVLRNAQRYIDVNLALCAHALRFLTGDMAQMAVESEEHYWLNTTPEQIVYEREDSASALLYEVERRGLSL